MDDTIPSYTYAPLDPTSREIRLVIILPEWHADRIKLEITHTILPPAVAESLTNQDSLVEIQRHLPHDWNVDETFEGRMLFCRESEDGVVMSQWEHPDPTFRSGSRNPAERSSICSYRPEYEALSYVWGSSETHEYAHIISSDGGSEVSRLGLAKGLSEAIRHLHDPQRRRVMWIDAICINQADDMERNEQVKRMDVIYRTARRVVAWLGPTCLNVDLAFEKISFVGQKIELLKSRACIPAPGHELRVEEDPFVDVLDTATWQAILRAASLPWFRRLWILQEIWLASPESVLKCGEAEIQWKLFRNGVFFLLNSPLGELERRLSNSGAYKLCYPTTDMTFESLLLEQARYRECSRHHDRIYGFLGVMPRTIATAIRDTIDYTKSVETVYKETFLLRVNQSRRLDMLQTSGGSESVSPPMLVQGFWPTWVPRWHIKRRQQTHSRVCTAAGYSPSEVYHIEPGLLEVAAVIISTVSTIEDPQVKRFSDITSYFRRADLQRLQETLDRRGQALFDTYLLSFLRGLTTELTGIQSWASFEEVKSYIFSNIGQAEGVVSLEADVPRIHPYQEMVIANWCSDSAIFTSADKVVGIGHPEMQSGDVVAVLLGCCFPLVLRPHDGTYKVIGDCYVPGFMEGQALLGPLEPHTCIQDIGSELGRRRVFVDTSTGHISLLDPRLGGIPLPVEWETAPLDDQKRIPDDPDVFCRFRHRDTGELINYDPRMTADALKDRGVPVQTLTLV